MKLFCLLGFLGALFDFFYAPCTSLGTKARIPVSPYVMVTRVCHA